MYMTIPGFETTTAQQIFDMSAKHLLKQGVCAKDDKGNCRYRANGLVCAAGVFLTDEGAQFADTLEDSAWDDVVRRGIAPANYEDLIFDLQNVHDGYIPDDWRAQLWQVAKNHNLNDAVVV